MSQGKPTSEIRKPRILLFDIETGYNLVRVFGLFGNNYIPHSSIEQERYMICAAWKWLGERRVHAVSALDDPARFAKNPLDDYHVVKTLMDQINQADAIIGHNGDKFDMPWVRTMMLKHKLGPHAPITQIDTLKIAKSQFKFNSNRLDYLGEFLGVGRKIKTDQQLWIDCMNGKKTAIREMVKYNKQDVHLLEAVYVDIRPYAPTKLNFNTFTLHEVCPKCGGVGRVKRGVRRTITRVYQQYQCTECHGYYSETISDKILKATVK